MQHLIEAAIYMHTYALFVDEDEALATVEAAAPHYTADGQMTWQALLAACGQLYVGDFHTYEDFSKGPMLREARHFLRLAERGSRLHDDLVRRRAAAATAC